MKKTIFLTMTFTASVMLNIFTFAPQCFLHAEAKPVMTAENLPRNPEFTRLVERLNALPKGGR